MSICSVYRLAASLSASNNTAICAMNSAIDIVVIASERHRKGERKRAQTTKKQPVSESVENKEQSFLLTTTSASALPHETMPGYLIDNFQPLQSQSASVWREENIIKMLYIVVLANSVHFRRVCNGIDIGRDPCSIHAISRKYYCYFGKPTRGNSMNFSEFNRIKRLIFLIKLQILTEHAIQVFNIIRNCGIRFEQILNINFTPNKVHHWMTDWVPFWINLYCLSCYLVLSCLTSCSKPQSWWAFAEWESTWSRSIYLLFTMLSATRFQPKLNSTTTTIALKLCTFRWFVFRQSKNIQWECKSRSKCFNKNGKFMQIIRVNTFGVMILILRSRSQTEKLKWCDTLAAKAVAIALVIWRCDKTETERLETWKPRWKWWRRFYHDGWQPMVKLI